jgi:hypothetical protein
LLLLAFGLWQLEGLIMRKLICGMLGLLLVACAPVHPGPIGADATAHLPSRSETESYIRRSAEQWAASDLAAMETFLADDYEGVASSGEVRNKARQLELAAQPSPYAASRVDYVNFRHIGNVVIAQGAETLTRRDGGPDRRLIWTDIWMFRNGRWQVVTSQDSIRPPVS